MPCTAMNSPRRRGIASLELVLVFPFLLTIVSALFLIARADMAKVLAATDARRTTWQDQGQANAGDLLKPWHTPQDSQISPDPQPPRLVSGGPPFSGPPVQAQSRNALIAQPWDSASVPFQSLEKNLKPHTWVLSQIGTQAAALSFDALSYSFDPGSNPLLVAASATGTVENAIVWADGAALKYTIGAAMDFQMGILNAMWDALNWSTFGLAGETDEGKQIEDALNKLTEFLNCFDNLFEAANGRLGADPFDN